MGKEELIKFYQNYKMIIFPVLVAICSVILIAVIVLPQTMKLLSSQEVENEILKKSQILEAKAQDLESYDQQDLSVKLNSALNSFPSDKDYAKAVGLLQELAIQSGFIISSLNLGADSQGGGGAQSYNINMAVLGPLDSVQNLLSSIESSSRIMRVKSLESSVKSDLSSASITLNIALLYSSFAGTATDIDSPLPELSEKDEEILAKLEPLKPDISSQLPARGKSNPFE